jgi:integrase
MSPLALMPAPTPASDDYAARLAGLIDLPELIARGFDERRLRFAPPASDPLFGYRRCPVRGCENVTEHTPTTLCTRCQHRFGRWVREHDGGDLDGFLAAVTQTRSADLVRLCLVCRTPGHERPGAAHGLCYSCLAQAKNRGQSVATHIAGDERWPPATPRVSFGICRMACDALAIGGDGLCGEHLRHWRHAGRPAEAAFEAWRATVGPPLPASREVDLGSLTDTLRAEFLVAVSVAVAGHRRTRISDMRRVVAVIGQRGVGSILELDTAVLRTAGVRLFVQWAQDHLRLSFADPDTEWRKDVWDMRVFGKPQAYRVDFTTISQPWLRELAKQWAREKAPLVHAAATRRAVCSIAELSRSLQRRDDHGNDPTMLERADVALFLARLARAKSAGRISAHKRSVLVADVAYFLRGARDLGFGSAAGRPMFGLPGAFSLSRDDVRRVARKVSRPAARALPETVVAQLLDAPALALLEQMHGQRVRMAIEVLADTGRRPNEISILAWDCLDYDTQIDESGTSQKLAVLVHDMPKVARTGCRLPIDQATAELILTQKRRIRERYPNTPTRQLRLFPRLQRNPRGTTPMTPMELGRVMRRWVTAMPALLDLDAGEFDRSRVVPYAFRHSYAQRHADHGTPVEVLRELMGHASMVTTQGYFRVREERARKAVQTLAPLQIDRHGKRTMAVVEQLLDSERLRRQVGQIAVPLGLCTEPSNVKARGHGCAYRYRCVGCEHFRTDPSNQAELREYLHQLLAGRERLATAVPQLAEWARRDAAPSDDEIQAVRALVRRNEQIIEELDPADRAAVLEAIATTRRLRAQLRVTIPERYQGITRPARPTLHPRPASAQS